MALIQTGVNFNKMYVQIILKILKFSNPNYVDVILIVGKKQVCKMLGMTEKGLTLDTLKEPKFYSNQIGLIFFKGLYIVFLIQM